MRRVLLLARLASALAVVACGGGGGTPPAPPPTACVNGQCPTGSHCELSANVCVENGCTTSADCPSGWACSGYACVQSGTTPCAIHADCAPDRLCSASTHTCQATLSCSTYTPCPGGWDCVSGHCQRLPEGTCKRPIDCFAAGDQCVAERCVGCVTTGMACTGGASRCDAATNACVTCASDADCADGLLCTAAGCAECDDNTDCVRFPGRPYCLKPMYTTVAAGTCGECGAGTYGCGTTLSCLPGDVCSLTSDCWSDGDCGGGHPRCDPGRHACVQCLADPDCPAGEVCRSGLCHVSQPGDRCQDPFELALGAGRTDVSLALAGFGCDRAGGSCYPGGADAFFRFTLATETRLELRATASDGEASAALQLWSDGCAAEVGYRLVSSGGAWTTYLPPGTWVLRVDGEEDVRYVLTAVATTPDLPAGNSCVEPIALVQSPNGSRVSGSTAGLLPVSGDACSDDASVRAPTAIYSLDLAAPSYVELTATPLSTSVLLDLDVKELCPAAPWRACNPSYGAAVTRTFKPLPAGRHYVVVDGENGTSGAFTLDAIVNPWMTNDRCADAKPLELAAGVATETGALDAHSAAASSACFCALPGACGIDLTACQPTGAAYQWCGNDAFYRFTTDADRRLDVSVAGDGTWIPAFTVRAACDAASGRACAFAGEGVASATVNVLPAGTWLVQVASKTAAVGGAFTLQVALSEPVYPVPSNDTCGAATALSPPGAQMGDTRGATDQESGACGGADPGAGGKDVAFRYTLPASRGRLDLAVRPVAPAAATFQPVLRVRDGCPGTQQLACAMAPAPGATAALAPLFLAPGTPLAISVDGAAGTAGTFALDPTFTPAPERDQCSGADLGPLDLTAIGEVLASGDLAAAWQDGACAGAQGPDVFYAVAPPGGNHAVRVTVQPSGFAAGLAFYGAQTCAASCAASPAPAVGAAPGQAVSLTVPANGKTLYFGVSSVGAERGTFTLRATLDPP